MEKLIVIAKIEALEHEIENVKAEFLNLVESTRKEAGCILYDLHQDLEDPALFIFYEIWEDKNALQTHMTNDEVVKCYARVSKIVKNVNVYEMEKIA